MEPADVTGATAATTSIAETLDLPVGDMTTLHNSNRLTLHLMPCDVVARVAHGSFEAARREVDLALRLAEVGCPVGVVEPRVAPRVYTQGGFAVTLWTYYEPVTAQLSPSAYARALHQLHTGMGAFDEPNARYTERIAEAQELIADPHRSPELADADRALLSTTLQTVRQKIDYRGATEQLLHGEPHRGNVVNAENGPVFIDLETCCRGPIEFDLAHVPETVSNHYPGIDDELLGDCRQLVLAMVAAWRWELDDEFPNARRFGEAFLHALREGPPWPTLDAVTRRLTGT